MSSSRIKILIIDDEEDLCFLLTSMLKAQGFDCLSRHSLHEGMLAIEQEKPDWIVVDNDLPDGRGWESTDDILKMAPGSKIIKISANPDSERTHFLPNIFYLIKPIHVNSITELIRKEEVNP